MTTELLREHANIVASKARGIDGCVAFIDGTVKPTCKPSRNDSLMYNGHKRVYGLKYQGVVSPDGIIIHLCGPFEGSKHDSSVLSVSGLYDILEEQLQSESGSFWVYGDAGYPITNFIQCPYKGNNLSESQKTYNTIMSKVRISIEIAFGEIVRQFAFIDFKKNLKVYLQQIGIYYHVATILTNCRTCLYKSQINYIFNSEPPTLDEYLIN